MKPTGLGKIVQHDDLEPAYAEDYYASGETPAFVDRSGEYDYTTYTDAALAEAERWARYYMQSGVRRGADHRLRAIHGEQLRRRIAADKKAR